MRLYQIGKFASKLGVTHDLLKHYEKYGIIKSVRQGDGGYRYYAFTQTPNILYSKRFQNWGFSLREIAGLLQQSGVDGYRTCLSRHIHEMKQTQTLKNRYLDDAVRLLDYMDQIVDGTFAGAWSIEEREAFLYLTHSTGEDFELIDVEPQTLASWTDHLSITDIATRIYRQEPDACFNRLSHGFLISEADARQFGILLPEHFLRIPRQKYLIYHSARPTGSRTIEEAIDSILKEPLALVQCHNFTISGDVYSRTLLQAHDGEGETIYRILYLPLEM